MAATSPRYEFELGGKCFCRGGCISVGYFTGRKPNSVQVCWLFNKGFLHDRKLFSDFRVLAIFSSKLSRHFGVWFFSNQPSSKPWFLRVKMTSIKPSEPGPDLIPEILCDVGAKKRYQRGRFLGKVQTNIYDLSSFFKVNSFQFNICVQLQFSGWLCEMLRADRYWQWTDLCRKDCVQTASCQASPEGQDGSRNLHPSQPQARTHCGFPQLLWGQQLCVCGARALQEKGEHFILN